jgi:hypothetical protein
MNSSGEEATSMVNHGLNVPYSDTSVMLGLALIVLWLRLRGRNVRDVLAQAMFSVSGYLRPGPDEAMECALRNAFTQLDKELAAVLADRPVPRPRPLP